MNTLFSTVSGQYPKYLIFGTMLPVVIFVLVDVTVSLPILPATLPLVKVMGALDKEWFVISLTFVVIVFTGFLYNLNSPLVRFYEGYTWGESWLGRRLIVINQARLQDLSTTRQRLRVTVRTAQRLKVRPQLVTELRDRQRKMAQTLSVRFPSEQQLVMPTRLGNAIRAFEEYARQQYGIDTIFIWPRLVAVVPKEYLAALDDAKSSFDFFLNSSVLSAVVAAQLLAIGLAFKRPFATDRQFYSWLGELGLLALLSCLFYLGAINRAIAWGGQVKAAFDLYRGDLLKQLGYKYKPQTRERERELWVEISQQIYYGDPDPTRSLPLPYEDLPVSLTHSPANVRLKVVYGFKRSTKEGDLDFECPIRNEDPQGRTAEGIVLQIHAPLGLEYIWDSARVALKNSTDKTPQLSEKLKFELGQLKFGEEAVFKCTLMPLSQKKT